jgi:hypothetical protein
MEDRQYSIQENCQHRGKNRILKAPFDQAQLGAGYLIIRADMVFLSFNLNLLPM